MCPSPLRQLYHDFRVAGTVNLWACAVTVLCAAADGRDRQDDNEPMVGIEGDVQRQGRVNDGGDRRRSQGHTFDTSLPGTHSVSHTFDTSLPGTHSVSHTSDTSLPGTHSVSHTFNTSLPGTHSVSHTSDTSLPLPGTH